MTLVKKVQCSGGSFWLEGKLSHRYEPDSIVKFCIKLWPGQQNHCQDSVLVKEVSQDETEIYPPPTIKPLHAVSINLTTGLSWDQWIK